MFAILVELLSYARKLLPLMELYAARRPSQPMRDPAAQEFQNSVSELVRSTRADLVELRSALETVNQRLKVVDDQSVALQREVARIADQQRTMSIAVLVAAIASVGAFIVALIALVRR